MQPPGIPVPGSLRLSEAIATMRGHSDRRIGAVWSQQDHDLLIALLNQLDAERDKLRGVITGPGA